MEVIEFNISFILKKYVQQNIVSIIIIISQITKSTAKNGLISHKV